MRVADLRVGDVAAAAPGAGRGGPSEVYAFSHAAPGVTSRFVRLVTAGVEGDARHAGANATAAASGAFGAPPAACGAGGPDRRRRRRRPLLLSPGHYLWVNGRLAAASTVVAGDALIAADGTRAVVTGVSRIVASGLFNPHTLGGSLVVDGLAVSCYTTAVRVGVADALLAPVRAAYRAGAWRRGGGAGGVLSRLSGLAWLVPSGAAVVT